MKSNWKRRELTPPLPNDYRIRKWDISSKQTSNDALILYHKEEKRKTEVTIETFYTHIDIKNDHELLCLSLDFQNINRLTRLLFLRLLFSVSSAGGFSS